MLMNLPVKVDPEKVKAISAMPRPSSSEEISRFNGMVNYLSRFRPNLSEVMKLLRVLTHKDTVWCWLETQEKGWNEAKRLIATTLVLAYHKPSENLEIQCDSSQAGLGMALMQNGHPIAYASRTLSEAEVRYVQTEKEMLAIVYMRGEVQRLHVRQKGYCLQ